MYALRLDDYLTLNGMGELSSALSAASELARTQGGTHCCCSTTLPLLLLRRGRVSSPASVTARAAQS